jgi:hypothetical protein
MKKILLSLLLLSYWSLAHAQNCNPYFAMDEGTTLTYEFRNAKGKVINISKNKFKSVSSSGNSITATLHTEIIDEKKGTVMSSSDSKWKCENGVIQFSMDAMAVEGVDLSNPAIEVDIEGDDMDIPSVLEPGQTLKDVNYRVKMNLSGLTMMDRQFAVKNRKVEGRESVTTPAGTFDCVKLTYTTESTGRGGGTTKPVQTSIWYATDIGTVKSEFAKDGKINSSQILTKVEK